MCENYIARCEFVSVFAHDKTVTNQRRVEKTAFEDQSEENSV